MEKTRFLKTLLEVANIKTSSRNKGHVNTSKTFVAVLIILLSHGEYLTAKHIGDADIETKFLKERKRLAKEWAPLVWLHSKEVFFPSNVEHFLSKTVASNNLDEYHLTLNQSYIDMSLPMGEESRDMYLIAPMDVDCSNCPIPHFLYGLKPSSKYTPPVYATIHSCIENNKDNTLDNPNAILKNQVNKVKIRVKSQTSRPYDSTTLTEKYSYENQEVTFHSYGSNVNSNTSNNITTNINTYPSTRYYNTTTSIPFTTSKKLNESIIYNTTTYINSSTSEETSNTTDTMINLSTNDNNTSQFNNWTGEEETEFISDPTTSDYSDQNFTVTYWMFYPYNNGKTVCSTRFWGFGRVPKLLENGTCKWEEVRIGNHVGDWEHVSIYFRNNKPEKMYVSTHYFGAFYEYNETKNKFIYYGQDARVGPLLGVNYPKEVTLDNMQPVLYSALGSHGLWTTPGYHIYNQNIIPLHDDTDQGILWNTQDNIQILDRRDMDEMYKYDKQWLRYEGRWGNPSHNCHIGLLGFCELSKGPQGIPMKRVNFPCHDYEDSTFHPSQ